MPSITFYSGTTIKRSGADRRSTDSKNLRIPLVLPFATDSKSNGLKRKPLYLRSFYGSTGAAEAQDYRTTTEDGQEGLVRLL